MKLILLPIFILLLNVFSFAQCTGEEVRGDALDFDGNDDYVRVLTNPALSTQMTAEAWISPQSFPNTWSLAIAKYYTLGNSGGVFTLGIFSTGKYQFGLRQSNGIEIRLQSVTTASTTPAHIAGVADGTNVKLYVNGIEEASAPYDGTINSSTRSMTIGRMRVEDDFGALDGTLDEVRLWDIGRTADEIRENMHLTLDGCETNLLAYYQMHDGAGSSLLTDKTGNGNDGTLTNMDPASDWVTSEMNIGNDVSANSNSVTNVGVVTGVSNFLTANLSIDFTAHSATEDICVTYENFTPNATTGAIGTNIIQNPTWTVNKSTTSSTQTMDMTFSFPVSTLTTSNPCQLNLYHRGMNSGGTWTLLGRASTATATTVTFDDITVTGQFMIVEENTAGADIGRGDALTFDGGNDHVRTGITSISTSFTLESWVSLNTLNPGTPFPKVFGKWKSSTSERDVVLDFDNSTNLFRAVINHETGVGATVITSATIPVVDEWYHVAMTYDGITLRLYINGVEEASQTVSNGIKINTSEFYIGSNENNFNYWNGQIDEARIWNAVRSADEIRENMHLTLGGCETGLLAYYQMNDGTGSSILTDKTGNGNDGTLTTMDPATDWVTSTVNVGNDVSNNSNSVTNTGVVTGVQNFVAANLSIDFTAHSATEDICVSYENFTPNVTTGATGTNLIQKPMWTVNKSTSSSTQTMDMTFIFPVSTLTTSNPCQLNLYNRSMSADGTWTLISTASMLTATTVTFDDITTTGQFMIVEENTVGADIGRGDALDFDGSNDFINTSYSGILGGNSRTIEAWIKVPSSGAGGDQPIVYWGTNSGGKRWTVLVQNTGALQARISAGLIKGTTNLKDNQWHHIAVVLENDGTANINEVELYVDGVLEVISSVIPKEINTVAGTNLRIGKDQLANQFTGEMDELRIWSLARSVTEIRENMHLTLGGCETGLAAYYQMNDGTGSSTLIDKTGNGNDGTLTNMNPANDWVTSGVNVGNDASSNSNSETITSIPSGTSTQNFATANLRMRFFQHSAMADYTVTYQAFTPNVITGATGINVIQNPMWTVNKSNVTATQVVDYNFTFPAATFTSLDPTKYGLYWRTMNDDGNWTKIATAHAVTTTTVEFGKISLIGQFMIVQESEDLISDVRGNMYQLDDVNDFIRTDNNITINNVFTWELWMKTNAGYVDQNYDGIISFYTPGQLAPRTQFNFNGAGQLRGSDDLVVSGGTNVNDEEWHHVALVVNGTSAFIYVDGRLDGTGTSTITGTHLKQLNFGAERAVSLVSGFSLDEVRIWNTARTQEELRENMHLTLKGNETGLVSYYQFNNDGAINSVGGVIDATGTSNATTQNMATSAYQASEVAVAGGTSDRITIGAGGVYTFPNTGVSIDFGTTTPNGEIVISRLETEKPHGYAAISGDVDNEYFVVNNYGSNSSFSPINDITFNRMSYISPSDVGLAQASSPLQLYKRGDRAFGATWGSSWGGADNSVAGTNGSVGYNTTNNLTSFSQLVVVNTALNSQLPVELLSFKVERMNADYIQLNWKTESETNNEGFYIERMLDIENAFKTISFVDGKGTTVMTNYYQEIDGNSYSGISYYRLKQVDFDGTVSYSEIRAIAGQQTISNNDLNIAIFPNPVEGQLSIKFKELPVGVQSSRIQLTSLSGQVLQEFEQNVASFKLLTISTVSELNAGVYLIRIELDNGETMVHKFIKL